MFRLASLAALALLLGSTDVPLVSPLRPQPNAPAAFPPGQELPVLPELSPPEQPQGLGKKDAPAARLQPESRLVLVRYVSGEFARAVRPLPSLKKGFRIRAGAPVDERALRQAVANGGSAASPGDMVQVTRLEFREKEIWLDINGGSKERKRWRDRIQVSVGGMPRVTTTEVGPPGYQRVGSTLVLDFGGPIPDLTPEQLKQHLTGYLDFSKQRSASVHWVETLPPEFQQAIKEKRAVVGMDREMVVAAMGRPDQKVRERDPDGVETEDWIYGQPPGKTIFVKFVGDKVISVKQFP